MHRGIRSLPIVALPTSFALLVMASLAGAHGQRDGHAGTPLQVAETLDCFVQPRFQQVDGKFGMSRIIHVNGHAAANLYAESAQEKKYLHIADSARRSYVVAFLHCAHAPASTGRSADRSETQFLIKQGSAERSPYLTWLCIKVPEYEPAQRHKTHRPTRAEQKAMARKGAAAGKRMQEQFTLVEQAGIVALPRLKRGEAVNTTTGRWFVAMRPVRASQPSCLGCHTTARSGDTLGVMVYMVSNTTTNEKTAQRPL